MCLITCLFFYINFYISSESPSFSLCEHRAARSRKNSRKLCCNNRRIYRRFCGPNERAHLAISPKSLARLKSIFHSQAACKIAHTSRREREPSKGYQQSCRHWLCGVLIVDFFRFFLYVFSQSGCPPCALLSGRNSHFSRFSSCFC